MTIVADQIEESIVVQAMLADVFNLWANFGNFPLFMPRLKSVTKTGERTSHWMMEGPLGTDLEWDAETTALEPNRRVAWTSLEGSQVSTSGDVVFEAQGLNETRVTVRMGYDVPGGVAGQAAAALFSSPRDMVKESLQRFKDHIESTATRLHEADPSQKTSQARQNAR